MALKAKNNVVFLCFKSGCSDLAMKFWADQNIFPQDAVCIVDVSDNNETSEMVVEKLRQIYENRMEDQNFIGNYMNNMHTSVNVIVDLGDENEIAGVKNEVESVQAYHREWGYTCTVDILACFDEAKKDKKAAITDNLAQLKAMRNTVNNIFTLSTMRTIGQNHHKSHDFIECIGYYCIAKDFTNDSGGFSLQTFYSNAKLDRNGNLNDKPFSTLGLRKMCRFSDAPIYTALEVFTHCNDDMSDFSQPINGIIADVEEAEKRFSEYGQKITGKNVLHGLMRKTGVGDFTFVKEALEDLFGGMLSEFYEINADIFMKELNYHEATLTKSRQMMLSMLGDNEPGLFAAWKFVRQLSTSLIKIKEDINEQRKDACNSLSSFESALYMVGQDLYELAEEYLEYRLSIAKYTYGMDLCKSLIDICDKYEDKIKTIDDSLDKLVNSKKDSYVSTSLTGVNGYEDYCENQMKEYRKKEMIKITDGFYSKLYNWYYDEDGNKRDFKDADEKVLQYLTKIINFDIRLRRADYIKGEPNNQNLAAIGNVIGENAGYNINTHATCFTSFCCFAPENTIENNAAAINGTISAGSGFYLHDFAQDDLVVLYLKGNFDIGDINNGRYVNREA